ncbi:uncharacterized protein MYU51_011339 [Penicillium brevicompactum]
MNYERMLYDIPEIFQTSGNEKEFDLLLSLLGWARNEAFGRVADTCALWGALVHANSHLLLMQARLTERNCDHESFNIASSLDLELEEARRLMENLPGGRHLLVINGPGEFMLAVKRIRFLREYNSPQ